MLSASSLFLPEQTSVVSSAEIVVSVLMLEREGQKMRHQQTDRQTDRKTNRQKDKQTERQADRKKNRQKEIQTETKKVFIK